MSLTNPHATTLASIRAAQVFRRPRKYICGCGLAESGRGWDLCDYHLGFDAACDEFAGLVAQTARSNR